MKKLTLKEVFMREQEDGPQNSRFVSSMRKQFGRARSQEELDHVASVYERILGLVDVPPEQAQDTLRAEDPLFKFHYRIAYQEFQKGTLDPDAAPTAQDIMEAELEKRHTAQASSRAAAASRPSPTPADQRAAHRRSVYGGDPDKNPGGLGT